MKRYFIALDRLYFKGCEHLELFALYKLEGLLYGLCSIPCNTKLYSCEIAGIFAVFIADCDEAHYKTFIDYVEKIYPGINKFIHVSVKES